MRDFFPLPIHFSAVSRPRQESRLTLIFMKKTWAKKLRINGLFTLDKILVFCAFSNMFLSIFWSRILPNNLDLGNKIWCMSEILCQFCTFSVPILYQKPKNLNFRNSVQILCQICTFSVPIL